MYRCTCPEDTGSERLRNRIVVRVVVEGKEAVTYRP